MYLRRLNTRKIVTVGERKLKGSANQILHCFTIKYEKMKVQLQQQHWQQ
jgi:hypothetical protein